MLLAITACTMPALEPSIEVSQSPPTSTLIPTHTLQPSPTLTFTPSSTFTPTPNINLTTSGVIAHNEIWQNEILITGDILIPKGITLRIEPGTIVRFTAQKDDLLKGGNDDLAIPERVYFPNDPPAIPSKMIVIRNFGTLESVGTLEDPIIFTSDSDYPSVNDWQGFRISGEAEIKFSIIEYSYWAVQLDKSSVLDLKNTIFQHIATCAICTGRTSIPQEIKITENTFIDCGHEGVDTYQNQNIIVRDNLFIENVVGVVANYGSEILIENNYFYYNDLNIGIFNKSDPTLIDNEIIWNIEGINLMDFLSHFE